MSPAPHPLEPDDHRRARHLFTLKALTDRGHTLAMKAADKAEASLDAPDPAPEDAPAPNAPNPHQTFERYVRLVRQLIGIEHRIADHTTQTKRTYRPANGADFVKSAVANDPRRSGIHEFIQKATRNSPDRAALRRAAVASLDEALERDTDLTLPAGLFLAEICEEYGLHFDISKIPDEFLEPPQRDPTSHDRPGHRHHPP